MKTVFVSTVWALALGLAAGQAAAAPDNARTSLDWNGTYRGKLPSASGSGYDTFLVLSDKGQGYTLMQSIEHKGKMEHFRSAGRFTWGKDGSHIALSPRDDRQQFFVTEGRLLRAPVPKAVKDEIALTKLLSYPGGRGEELLIDPTTIKTHEFKKGTFSFDGVWNMDRPTQAGHRSLAAHFEVDCKAKTYRMPTMTYHARTYLQGKVLDRVKNNDNDIPVTPQDRTMTRVLKDHCPQ